MSDLKLGHVSFTPYAGPIREPFFKGALKVLQDCAFAPPPTVEELVQLKKQIDVAISLIESGRLVPMTARERMEFAGRFPKGSFVVGDFVIRKI